MAFTGYVYEITYNDLHYYGSTTQNPNRRHSQHTRAYEMFCCGDPKYKYASSFEVVKHKEHIFNVLEIVSSPSFLLLQDTLFQREQYYMDNFPCVNKKSSYTGINREDYDKEYYKEKSEILKQKAREKVVCRICGVSVSRGYYPTHRKKSICINNKIIYRLVFN